jgi:hypothetical protein
MARSRRESHQSDGITDQKNLQLTSATKSAIHGLMRHTNRATGVRLRTGNKLLTGDLQVFGP